MPYGGANNDSRRGSGGGGHINQSIEPCRLLIIASIVLRGKHLIVKTSHVLTVYC